MRGLDAAGTTLRRVATVALGLERLVDGGTARCLEDFHLPIHILLILDQVLGTGRQIGTSHRTVSTSAKHLLQSRPAIHPEAVPAGQLDSPERPRYHGCPHRHGSNVRRHLFWSALAGS